MIANRCFALVDIIIYSYLCMLVLCNENDKSEIRSRPLWAQTGVDKLKKDLLTNYDRYARPQAHNEVTNVDVGLTIINVETQEMKSVVLVTSWLSLSWNDSKLQWNSSEYENISLIRMADHEVWQPDIFLYNSALGNTQLPRYGYTNVLVNSNGHVIWVPSLRLTALCDFDMTHWPNDVQFCNLKFGSWVQSGNEILLGLEGNVTEATFGDQIHVSEWNITTTAEIEAKKYNCCEETYYMAIYNLTMTRRTSSYSATLVAPAVVAVFFILFQFWLPPDASEKIFLNGFVFVMLNMFLIHLNHKVVGTASTTPNIVLFYSRCLWIVMTTTLFSIVSYCSTKIQKNKPPPLMFENLLQTTFCKILYWNFDFSEMLYCKREVAVGHNDEGASEGRRFSECSQIGTRSPISQQWNTILIVMDRLLFACFTFIFLVLAIMYA